MPSLMASLRLMDLVCWVWFGLLIKPNEMRGRSWVCLIIWRTLGLRSEINLMLLLLEVLNYQYYFSVALNIILVIRIHSLSSFALLNIRHRLFVSITIFISLVWRTQPSSSIILWFDKAGCTNRVIGIWYLACVPPPFFDLGGTE